MRGPAAGVLYVVATPLGNLEDITLRALRILKEVDLIAAEDTRHTKKLLHHYGIRTPLVSYHSHNQKLRAPELIAKLKEGQRIALVSDAGTPGFSDPGTFLVAKAWEAEVKVEAVPGPTAAVAALSMSGFPGAVTFVGFPPRQAGAREELFASLSKENRVLIFYESPRRLLDTLHDMSRHFPDRQVLVVRELTKLFEEAWRGPLSEVTARLGEREIRGECTVVLSCPARAAPEGEDLGAVLRAAARTTGLTGRRLAEMVAQLLHLPRRRVYRTYLALKKQGILP